MSLESFAEKVRRHVREGSFDWGTVARGVSTMAEWMRSRDILSCSIADNMRLLNLGHNRGLNDARYDYIHNRSLDSVGTFNVVDFPADSSLEISVTKLNQSRGMTASLEANPRAIAEFVGPTHLGYGALANNGFFFRNQRGSRVTFMDTNPPGERRGAVVVDRRGKTRIVKDDEKWQIVRSKFKGVHAMAGTSVFLTNQDTPENTELLREVDRSMVSYLIQYIDAFNQTRLSYVVISTCVPRIVAQFSIAHHMDRLKVSEWIAAELELQGSGCLVKDRDSGEIIRVGDHWTSIARRDHYAIVRPRG